MKAAGSSLPHSSHPFMRRASLLWRARKRRVTLPLRYHLIVLVVIALVPALYFAGLAVRSLGREHRQSVEQSLQTTVRTLAIAVEHDIEASVTALEVLGTSNALDEDDLRSFYGEAMSVLERVEGWYVVALTDARGQLLMNTTRPFGAPLPPIADREYIREVIRSGRPAVSDLIFGRITGQRNVTVAIPVRRLGEFRYILFAGIRPESMARTLAAQQLPADWIAGIADRRQVLIARSQDPRGFVGHELPAPVKQAVGAAATGTARFPAHDSPDVYAAWHRITSLGWTVTLGAPVASVDVPFRESMWRLAVGGVLAILGAGTLAAVLGRHISGAMGRLKSGAVALGHGATPACVPSTVEEIDSVGVALERAGQTIGERNDELRRSQDKLKRLVDSSLIGVIVTEGDRVTDANGAFLRMVGYSRDDVREGSLLWRSLTPPEYAAADAAARAAARWTGACAPYEKAYIRKDGTRVSVLVGPVLLDDARNEWVAFVLDLTERNRLEAERALRIQAQSANQAKDEFLAVVSHELRTPMGAVLNSVHVLRRAALDESKHAEILDRIDRSTRLQARLINDLLDASRIIAGKLQVDKQPVRLLPIVAAAVGAFRSDAHDKGVDIRTRLDAPTASVLGDPERLQQIALNLIANAIKFTPAGGHVEVALGRRGDHAVLTVRDTGHGIAPELIPHIFERFRQGEAGVRLGGLGLGLAIVRHLVEAHDGTVRADSPGPGRGAVLTVELPLHGDGETC